MNVQRDLESIRYKVPKNIGAGKITVKTEYGGLPIHAQEVRHEKVISYRNGLPYPVVIVERGGVAITIPPISTPNKTTSDFVVDVTYRMRPGVDFDTYHTLDVEQGALGAELANFSTGWSNIRRHVSVYDKQFTISYHVTQSQLNNMQDKVYIRETDTTLTLELSALNRVHHYYSEQGMSFTARMEDIGASFYYRIDIVDPNNEFGSRYINIAGSVHRISHIPVSIKDKGVYVTIYTRGDNRDAPDIEEVYYSFTDAEILPLYLSKSEAISHGDPIAAEKRKYDIELLKTKQDLAITEKELKTYQMSAEREATEYKNNLAHIDNRAKETQLEMKLQLATMEKQNSLLSTELAVEKEHRDALLASRKHVHEMRSFDRKDSSEVVKWLPAIIAAIGALLLAFNKR